MSCVCALYDFDNKTNACYVRWQVQACSMSSPWFEALTKHWGLILHLCNCVIFLINPYERTRGLWKWWRKTKRSEEKRLCASKQKMFSSIISVVRFRQTKTQMKSWVGFSICRFIHIIHSLIYSHNTSLLDTWPLLLGRCEGAQVTGITSVRRDIRFQVNLQFLWASDFTAWQLLI